MRPTSRPLAPGRYDLDMTRLEDEQLVVLAGECGHRPARDELIRRSLPLAGRLIRRHASHSGLQEADHQDARQDAVLWIVEAIRRYRAEEHVKPRGCRFRSFLHRVVRARFIDLLRHRSRLRSRFPLTGAGRITETTQAGRRTGPAARGDPGPQVGSQRGRTGCCCPRRGRFTRGLALPSGMPLVLMLAERGGPYDWLRLLRYHSASS
jgi:hypothetical protein